LGQFSKNYRTFYPKNVTKLSNIRVWDPGSGIRDPGAKEAPDPGSGSATLEIDVQKEGMHGIRELLLYFQIFLLKIRRPLTILVKH
jgi:hypothetical protein